MAPGDKFFCSIRFSSCGAVLNFCTTALLDAKTGSMTSMAVCARAYSLAHPAGQSFTLSLTHPLQYFTHPLIDSQLLQISVRWKHGCANKELAHDATDAPQIAHLHHDIALGSVYLFPCCGCSLRTLLYSRSLGRTIFWIEPTDVVRVSHTVDRYHVQHTSMDQCLPRSAALLPVLEVVVLELNGHTVGSEGVCTRTCLQGHAGQ